MKKESEVPNCINCIQGNTSLCKLNDAERELLNANKKVLYVKKGDIVFEAGNKANSLFCVANGKLKISKLGKEGKEQIIRLSKKGDILGYRSLLSDEPYSASSIAMEESTVCEIPKSIFFQVYSSNYQISMNLIQLLTKDLKTAEQHLIDVAQKSVRERISESLMTLINTFGFKNDNKTINVQITRSEIADMSSTTTESAIRTLSQLNNEGIIQLDGKRIVVSNLELLKKNVDII